MRAASLIATFAAAAGLSACANTEAYRTLAGRTAAQASRQEASLGGFLSAQQRQNQDLAADLDVVKSQAAAQQAHVDRVVLAWTLAGKKDLLAQQALAARVRAPDIVASLATSRTPPAILDDGGAGASLAKASSGFAAMARKPGFLDQAKEIYAAGDAVYAALKTLQAAPKAPVGPAAKPVSAAAPPKTS